MISAVLFDELRGRFDVIPLDFSVCWRRVVVVREESQERLKV